MQDTSILALRIKAAHDLEGDLQKAHDGKAVLETTQSSDKVAAEEEKVDKKDARKERERQRRYAKNELKFEIAKVQYDLDFCYDFSPFCVFVVSSAFKWSFPFTCSVVMVNSSISSCVVVSLLRAFFFKNIKIIPRNFQLGSEYKF